jgi:hypothetical protein
MATTDLMIGIGAEYKGKAAFNKANKDVLGLGKGVQNLAKAYIGLQGAQKAFRYGQQSLKAFVEDDKAARKLAQTVGNLGLAYEATNVENFIQGLETTYAIADDLLRPAMAKLIQVTQSYSKSKEIMTTALNAAAGAGVDLGTAVTDLSQAYVGNLRGLRKYNLGLSQAELATKSFQEIQDLLNKTFSGQAALAADTYAYKLDRLAIASNNAKEIIGRGLVTAISDAFGGGSIDKATTNIEKMAQAVSDIIAGLGTMTGWFTKLVKLTDKFTVGNFLQNRQPNTPYDPRSGNMPDMSPEGTKIVMQRQKADREAAKRQKELASLAGKQTKALKEQTALAKAKAVLDKANAVFNLDLIQNTAALQGKITEDESLRLRLQREILLGNSKAAADLAQELLSVQLAAIIAGNVDPFGKLSDSVLEALKSVKQLRSELELLGSPKVKSPAQILAEDYQDVLIDLADPSFDLAMKEIEDFLNSSKTISTGNMDSNYQDAFARPNAAAGFTPTELRIFIDPSAAAYGINAAVVGANANGTASTVNRNGVFSYGS